MRRLRIVMFSTAVVLVGSQARGQWIFDPAMYEQAGRNLGQAAGSVSRAVRTVPSFVPHPPVAEGFAGTPRQPMEWDQSGIIGRHDRDAQWRHDEKMTGIDAYLKGLKDGIYSHWPPYWNPPIPGPYPPILGAPGHGRPPKTHTKKHK